MAHDASFPHLFQSFPNQRVLVGMQLDVIGDRLVDEIAARTFLCGGQRIKRFNLFGVGTETDGFVIATHNARTITHIIVYYKSVGNVLNFALEFFHFERPDTWVTVCTGHIGYTFPFFEREGWRCLGRSVRLWMNVFVLSRACSKERKWLLFAASSLSRAKPATRSLNATRNVVWKPSRTARVDPGVMPTSCPNRWRWPS